MTSDRSGNELKSDRGLFENLPPMGQVYNAAYAYHQPRDIDMVVNGATGIRRRTRLQHEEPNVNPVMKLQGTANRRIRLGGLVVHSLGYDEAAKDESYASEDHNSKPATSEETKASKDHAASESESGTSDVDEPEETSQEVSDSDETASYVSEDHASEDDNSEPTTARESSASEDHASSESSTVTNDTTELEEISRMLAASGRRRIGK